MTSNVIWCRRLGPTPYGAFQRPCQTESRWPLHRWVIDPPSLWNSCHVSLSFPSPFSSFPLSFPLSLSVSLIVLDAGCFSTASISAQPPIHLSGSLRIAQDHPGIATASLPQVSQHRSRCFRIVPDLSVSTQGFQDPSESFRIVQDRSGSFRIAPDFFPDRSGSFRMNQRLSGSLRIAQDLSWSWRVFEDGGLDR